MKRSEFILTGMSIMGITAFKSLNMRTHDPELLIGKGTPELVGKDYALLSEVAKAYEQMAAAAKKEGIIIKVVSSYRSYDHQKAIWNRKFAHYKAQGMEDGQIISKILEYSTLPGTSRHHWGTEVDIIDAIPPAEGDVLLPQKFHDKGPYTALREWLEIHANKFGFFLPYTQNKDRSGFKYEPWHYSFAPISIPFLKSYLKIDLNASIIDSDIGGKALLDQDFLRKYTQSHVMGIDKSLL